MNPLIEKKKSAFYKAFSKKFKGKRITDSSKKEMQAFINDHIDMLVDEGRVTKRDETTAVFNSYIINKPEGKITIW